MAHQQILTVDISPSCGNEANSRDGLVVHKAQHHASKPRHKDVRFWGIMVALCVATLLEGLETTIVTTSLPTIVKDLNIGDDYVWITNVLFLTSAAVQPLFGQLANIFGRRWLALFIVSIYTLGSGICGGANSGAVLIAGRSIQGIGTGGLNMILDIILSDLLPLRERGTYIAITLVVLTMGTSLGPFIGGAIVDNTTWRWVFYINLPFGALSFILLFVFLGVKHDSGSTWREKLKRIDFAGNAILMASTTLLLYTLTYGGTRFPWSSTTVILPLVTGFSGMVLFVIFEKWGWAQEPVIPLRLFANRTAAVIFINTFLSAILLYWAIFFLSVYFQAVLVSTAVIVLSKFGRYKALHGVGFAIVNVGLGLFSTLDESSSTSEWVSYQVLIGIGTGMILNTLLPAFQASQPERDQAAATASWAFIRSFGCIWGVTIPAAIFNNRLQTSLDRISDPNIRAELASGQAYGRATREYISQFQNPTRLQIIQSFVRALEYTWWISVAFSGVAFLLVLFEIDIPLRTELHTEFGLEEVKLTGATRTNGQDLLFALTASIPPTSKFPDMDDHNDKVRQRRDSHFGKESSMDDLSRCAALEYDYEHSTQWPDWQRYYYEEPEASLKPLATELLEHQLGLCVNAMLVIIISHILFPDLRDKTGGFFMLSYPLDDLYGIGTQDLKLVLGFMTFFTATRAASLDYVLKPLAERSGITKTKTQIRFAEQSYMICYYTLYWSWGLRLFTQHTPAEVNGVDSLLISLWTGFPQMRLDASLKCYYISQLAFWLQQIAVLHLERRRKDHLQMLLDHIVTIILLTGRYSYPTGNLLSPQSNNDVFVNIFQPFLIPLAKNVAFNANIRRLFLGLLLLLQCITVVWFAMIVRVIIRMICVEGATDSRSDDEEED
ncbi:hypothetical protein MBLNU13_g05398t2 [Cladosporium sp. NU13]